MIIRVRATIAVQHDHPRLGPHRLERIGICAQVIRAVKRAIDECKWAGVVAHTVNEEPQPQVVLALGLRITNCAPLKDSL